MNSLAKLNKESTLLKVLLFLCLSLMGATSQSAPIFRYYNPANGDHLLSLTPNEYSAYESGYNFEGYAFSTLEDCRGGRALYRCFGRGYGHFASLDPYCDGYRNEGPLGAVSPYPTDRAYKKLVRCESSIRRDHLITSHIEECYNSRYSIVETLGYVADY